MLRRGYSTIWFLLIAIFAACGTVRAVADDNAPLPSSTAEQSQADELQMAAGMVNQGILILRSNERPQDLTLANFFSAGWDDEWAKQERATGTPNMALLRVQTNFMEREFRANYYFGKQCRQHDDQEPDRFRRAHRLELQSPPDVGNHRRLPVDRSAYRLAKRTAELPDLVGRVQLIDTESSSYSFNFKAAAPNQELGVSQTTVSYGVAGFEDLAYWFGFNRVGLYYSFLFDSFAGPVAEGTKLNDVGYDITLAKTVTGPETPLLGNLTFFVENYAQTDLDGSHGRADARYRYPRRPLQSRQERWRQDGQRQLDYVRH